MTGQPKIVKGAIHFHSRFRRSAPYKMNRLRRMIRVSTVQPEPSIRFQDTDYLRGLSAASKRSLELQGGPFDAAGVRSFEAEPYFRDAVRLRRWDDEAKVPALAVPGLDHYRGRLAAVARRREG